MTACCSRDVVTVPLYGLFGFSSVVGCLKSNVADLLKIRKKPPPILLLPSDLPDVLAVVVVVVVAVDAVGKGFGGDFRSPEVGEQFCVIKCYIRFTQPLLFTIIQGSILILFLTMLRN